MNKGEKYLPVGSVVLLKDAQQKLMITGFIVQNEKGQTFDYCGCPYPFGVLSMEINMLFNHDQIETLFFKGYSNDEEVFFKQQLNELESSGKLDELLKQVKKPQTTPNPTVQNTQQIAQPLTATPVNTENN